MNTLPHSRTWSVSGWQAIVILLLVTLLPASYSQAPSASAFAHPPASAGPWVFWMWLRVQTNHESITADLEAMRATGIRGAILYDSGVGSGMEVTSRMEPTGSGYTRVPTKDFAGAHFTRLPFAPMASWEPESRALVRWAAKEAGRLGLHLVVTTGLASTSGQIQLQDGQQFLEWSETLIRGSQRVQTTLPMPDHAVPPVTIDIHSLIPEKLAAGSHPDYMHTIAVLAIPDKEAFAPAEVIDLTTRIDAAGRLTWDAPSGSWRILKFAYEPTGMKNAWGLYTDSMSMTALDRTWDVTMGPLLREMSPEERRGLYGVEDDSWEAGASTWTAGYEREFQLRRNYSLVSWLPALAGFPVGTPAQRAAVRRDYERTNADLIAEHHYDHLGALARKNGLLFFSEAAGPNSGQLDPQRNFADVDVPMGEFWMPSEHRPTPDRRFLARDAASAAHVYGKRLLGCESLTSVGPHWEESFFDMKNVADQGFADGCNLPVIHNFSQSPSLTAKPGYVYFAGTHYERGVTWWKETPAFNTYLARTSYLLQQGVFFADVLYFRGDGIGQVEQRKTEPALPFPGYDHDNLSLDGLLHEVHVQAGRIALRDGATYAMLVLPTGQRVSMQAMEKIAELVRAGALVVGPPPVGPSGLASDGTTDDAHFQKLVSDLWNPRAAHHVLDGTAHDGLVQLGLAPDVRLDGVSKNGVVDWIHRKVGAAEIYFLANRWEESEKISATFRVQGLQPELWDAVTGVVRSARAFVQADGTTTVPLQFDPHGSVFVVFRRPIADTVRGTAKTNYDAFRPVEEINTPWSVTFDPKWKGPGTVTFERLQDWTQHPDPGIRYYSGTALYETAFRWNGKPSSGGRVFLNLGTVHEIASVTLNGHDLGVVWTRPARIDITAALKLGSNDLKLDIVNLWPNRLIGDESLPSEQRVTETNAHKFNAHTPLYPSGLLGPVTLEQALP